ncbi:MAG: SDR family oxidoreductase [Pseudomonadota bacterium]
MDIGAALVTGAGARVGKAMAIALGQAGWSVAVHFNASAVGAEETVAAIKAAGGRAVSVQADLSDPEAVQNLVPKAAAALGKRLTLLVNSASTFADDTLETHTAKGWDYHFDTNTRAPITLAQGFAKDFPTDQKGLIVNLIDQRVLKLNPQFFTYMLSKSALWTATRTMAQSLAANIRVNGIGPGPTLKSIHQTDDDFDAEKVATLTKEGTSPAEIVKALMYLVDADSVTGQMIASDGGQHLLWQTPDLQD